MFQYHAVRNLSDIRKYITNNWSPLFISSDH